MKTITLVANEPYHSLSGGIPRFLQEIAPRLSKHFQVNVAVIGSSTHLETENLSPTLTLYHFPYYKIPIGDSHPPHFLRQEIKNLIKQSDSVFVQTSDCLVPLYYCKKFKKPLLMYFHGIDWETFPRALGLPNLAKFLVPFVKAYARYWYNQSSLLFIPSQTLIPLLKKAGITATQKVLPLGSDLKKFFPPSEEQKNSQKEKMGFKATDKVIGYTGRLAREKNIGFLISSFEKLQKQLPNIKLLLVGSGVKDFEAAIQKNKDIVAVGQQNDVLPYLWAMDVFVMPSQTETSSLSTLEAMASGLPCVAHDVGCLKDYIASSINSVLVPLHSSEEFVSKILQLLQEGSLRKKMGEEAFKTMQTRLTWEECAETLSTILKNI